MNLLEKMKSVSVGNKMAMALEYTPAICRAVLAAMDEIEKQSESIYPDQLKEPAYCNGLDDALFILHKHLEGENHDNHS